MSGSILFLPPYTRGEEKHLLWAGIKHRSSWFTFTSNRSDHGSSGRSEGCKLFPPTNTRGEKNIGSSWDWIYLALWALNTRQWLLWRIQNNRPLKYQLRSLTGRLITTPQSGSRSSSTRVFFVLASLRRDTEKKNWCNCLESKNNPLPGACSRKFPGSVNYGHDDWAYTFITFGKLGWPFERN